MINIFNKDQVKGKLIELYGRFKLWVGELFGNKEIQRSGEKLSYEGYALKTLGDMQAAIERAVGRKIY